MSQNNLRIVSRTNKPSSLRLSAVDDEIVWVVSLFRRLSPESRKTYSKLIASRLRLERALEAGR